MEQRTYKASDKARAARREYMRRYKANMTPEKREALRTYQREWRRNNPDKVRANTDRYWERQAAKLQASGETASNV